MSMMSPALPVAPPPKVTRSASLAVGGHSRGHSRGQGHLRGQSAKGIVIKRPATANNANKCCTLPGVGAGLTSSTSVSHLIPTDFGADELAHQLTLLDLPVFTAIQPEELSSCSWNKKNKLEVAPNVVAFIKRFNHVSFWAVQEVLRFETAKQRAEVLAHLIKVAKRLHELNNLHCEFAILSAMQSAAIYRLSKTWSHLSRKDRSSFDKLVDLFSERDNFARLREHMNGIALKHQDCIPYLGLYLTDIVYVDMAHPHSGGLESQQRQLKMNNILRIVSELQQSTYSHLAVTPVCQLYLRSIRYIDELQKFIEDDHFKLSLKLEPVSNPSGPSSASSKESIKSGSVRGTASKDPSLVAELNLSPAKGNSCIGSSLMKQPQNRSNSTFVPGHRKSRSDGASIFLSCSSANKEDILSWTSENLSSADGSSEERFRHHLLDDSLLEDPFMPAEKDVNRLQDHILCDEVGAGMNMEKLRLTSEAKGSSPIDVEPGTRCSLQGCIKRKTLIKEGRRPTMSGWQRYWLQLWGSSLVFFPPKPLTKGLDRRDFRTEPTKCQSVVGWLVMVADSTIDNLSFQLTDPVRRTVYRFRAPTPELARQWVDVLHRAVRGNSVQSPPANLISFE